jgi:hypothetical protein
MKSAVDRFIALADQVIVELEQVISTGNTEAYPNAAIALRNVRAWRESAAAGILPGSYLPNFGIARSDLLFGKVEDRMYELERIYENEIRDFGIPGYLRGRDAL